MASRDRAAVADALGRAQRAVVVMHVLPDGDTTGSALGLAAVLAAQGKAVTVVSPEPVLPGFRFLPGAADVVPASALPLPGPRADVVVTVDCGTPGRCLGPVGLSALAPMVINIDHHASNPRFGDLNWVEPERAAVGEMLVDLCDAAGWPLTGEAALCLYVSVASDTEGFRFGSHDSHLLEMAARLVRIGLDPDAISRRLWEARTWPAAQLSGWTLSHLERTASGRVAWVRLPQDVQVRLGARPEDAEGLVASVRGLEGVQLALFFREEARGTVKLSLRSRPPFEAGKLAEELGGGGHRHSAGVELSGGLDDAVRQVRDAVARAYGETMAWTDLST